MGANQSTEHSHLLNTDLGSLKGIELRDEATGKPVCHRYVKIPYALPPVGPLRWRRPQPLPSSFNFSASSGEAGDYTKFGPICPQPHYDYEEVILPNPDALEVIENVQDEDCLYLNVWVPAGPSPPGGWPVQFYLHGGWLQVGNACQSYGTDPFNLLANSTPRIIVSPTYRLNLFGFLAGNDLSSLKEDAAAANYGFWDQRCALEWTAKHISLFGGNPDNITVGGLSAGANSTFFQLYYDIHLPESQRLIKRIFLWSNAVAIQPNSTTSPALTAQFNELCSVCNIPESSSPSEKVTALRKVSSSALVEAIGKLKFHTFRASTDSSFIPPTFLASLHSGSFATLLEKYKISVLLGEVSDELELYKFVNPPSSYSQMVTQLANYYPKHVVDALLPIYPVPDHSDQDAEKWINLFSRIVADCQIHMTIRGLEKILLHPPSEPGVRALPSSSVHRYRIEWRARSLDKWLLPSAKVCHGGDEPVWWATGWRTGFSQKDKETTLEFLKPFGQFLAGEPVKWGKKSSTPTYRVITPDGVIKEDVEDKLWDRGMEVWDAVWKAQEPLVQKE